MQTELVNLLTCPKSGKIFCNPVVCNGVTLEGDFCDDENKIPWVSLRSFIASFLDEFPEYKTQQYVFVKKIIEHKNAQIAINNILKSRDFSKLVNYNNFSISYVESSNMQNFIVNGKDHDLKYFIDNMENIHEICPKKGWALINYLSSHCSNNPVIFKYAIDKGCNVKSACVSDGWLPIHQVLTTSNNNENIKLIIDTHLNTGGSFFDKTGSGHTVMFLAFKKCSANNINYIFTLLNQNVKSPADNMQLIFDIINSGYKIADDNLISIIAEHINIGGSLFDTNNQGHTIMSTVLKYCNTNIVHHVFTIVDRSKQDFIDNREILFNMIDGSNNLTNENKESIVELILG